MLDMRHIYKVVLSISRSVLFSDLILVRVFGLFRLTNCLIDKYKISLLFFTFYTYQNGTQMIFKTVYHFKFISPLARQVMTGFN